MIQPQQLFGTDPGKITDFSSVPVSEIFNQTVVPRLTSIAELFDLSAGLDEAKQRREARLAQTAPDDLYMAQQQDPFVSQPTTQPDFENYNAPLPMSTPSAEPTGAQVRGAPVAQNLTDFVKHFEGYNPKAYGDFKQTSIGYGTRARKGETSISKEEAESRLSSELGKARSEVEALNKKHGYDFAPNQLDALTSFAYNVGSLNQLTENGKRDKETIAKKILEYNKAGGKVLPGLMNRRKAEHNLFVEGY